MSQIATYIELFSYKERLELYIENGGKRIKKATNLLRLCNDKLINALSQEAK